MSTYRSPNTNTRGGAFTPQEIVAVWQKAPLAPGYDPAIIRKDRCGALIAYNDYGKTSSILGWEIDHDLPVARGGTDVLSNLQPLQWQNNRFKGDAWPHWACRLSA